MRNVRCASKPRAVYQSRYEGHVGSMASCATGEKVAKDKPVSGCMGGHYYQITPPCLPYWQFVSHGPLALRSGSSLMSSLIRFAKCGPLKNKRGDKTKMRCDTGHS